MSCDVHLTRTVDAHWSSDDNGWYLSNYLTGQASVEVWRECCEARNAYEIGSYTWAD